MTLLDVLLPDAIGIRLIKQLKEIRSETKVIVQQEFGLFFRSWIRTEREPKERLGDSGGEVHTG